MKQRAVCVYKLNAEEIQENYKYSLFKVNSKSMVGLFHLLSKVVEDKRALMRNPEPRPRRIERKVRCPEPDPSSLFTSCHPTL